VAIGQIALDTNATPIIKLNRIVLLLLKKMEISPKKKKREIKHKIIEE
jgi:hypothetical protein